MYCNKRNNYIVAEEPEDEEQRLKELTRLTESSTKYKIELVTPSVSYTHANASAWSLLSCKSCKERVVNVFASNVYILAGNHILPQALPQTSKTEAATDRINLQSNLRELLVAEAKKGFCGIVDARRVCNRTRARYLAWTGGQHDPEFVTQNRTWSSDQSVCLR